jgi:hypothetical protein
MTVRRASIEALKRIVRWLTPASLLLSAVPALAQEGPAGRYRLAGGPDVASELLVGQDGHFQYFLMAGALDERAEGHWVASGPGIRFYTDPRPVPAAFSIGPAVTTEQVKLSLVVAWPNGRGIAGIDFRIGFASGDPVTGYTQEYGWSMPLDETRTPLWIELVEPIHGVVSPRFPIDFAKGNSLRFTLTPNDIEIFDFQGALADVRPGELLLHRSGEILRYVRERAEKP